jgi:hypothetical protein
LTSPASRKWARQFLSGRSTASGLHPKIKNPLQSMTHVPRCTAIGKRERVYFRIISSAGRSTANDRKHSPVTELGAQPSLEHRTDCNQRYSEQRGQFGVWSTRKFKVEKRTLKHSRHVKYLCNIENAARSGCRTKSRWTIAQSSWELGRLETARCGICFHGNCTCRVWG